MSNWVLQAEGLKKTYRTGPDEVTVWKDVNFQLEQGKMASIVGASGSGKTTLLNVLGGLDELDGGEVKIDGNSLHQMPELKRTALRNQSVGFVYQFHHLLAEFTALENVMMPLLLRGDSKKKAKQKALSCLQQVGLDHRAEHKPSELSGGERQRVAIARAIVGEPKLVLLDEPTGNLDQQTASQVEEVLMNLANSIGTAFVLVTHDEQLADRADEKYRLLNGTLSRA